jgi:hypothetical protein
MLNEIGKSILHIIYFNYYIYQYINYDKAGIFLYGRSIGYLHTSADLKL